MFPVILDTQQLNIVMIGDGPATARRKQLLEEAGCAYVCHPEPTAKDLTLEEILRAAQNDIAKAHIVFIADFDEETSAQLYQQAKAAGALVNVEDKKPYCDFHVPAIVRRGDLLLTVSTNAKSPRLARRIRQKLQQQFGEEWAERLNLLGNLREGWRKQGVAFEELARKSDEVIDGNHWLEHKA